MKKKTVTLTIALVSVAAFLLWRFIRPVNIFVISEAFERPIDTSGVPASLKTLRAEECGTCHQDYYEEWETTVHSQAWTDPYFQVDWTFEGKEQICRNGSPAATAVEAVARYHLLDEARRKRIGYENKEPIDYEVFRQQIALPER
jgi:hypothetical protein